MMQPDDLTLFRLVYRSRSALDGTASEVQCVIDAIIERSRTQNSDAGVTGAIMFTRFLFVQALEGPVDAVETIFDRICCDVRHNNLEIIECGPILERGFGNWSMSHLVPDENAGALLDRFEDDGELADAAAAAMKLMAALIKPISTASLKAHRLKAI